MWHTPIKTTAGFFAVSQNINTNYVLQLKHKIPLNIQIQFALAYVKYINFQEKNLQYC